MNTKTIGEFEVMTSELLEGVVGGEKWIPVGTALCPNGVISAKCKPNWEVILNNAVDCFNNDWFANFGIGGCGRPNGL